MYYSLKLNIKSPDIAICSYLRYELFYTLDHLRLNVYHHFVFCTRTCNINGICLFCTRILFENSDLTKKCRQMFKGLKLDNCNRYLVMLFYGSKLWFYNFDICNPNLNFISIYKTKKQGCLFFKTCYDQKDICLVFAEKLVPIYLNLTKNIYKIFTKKYGHLYWLEFSTMNVLTTHIA